MNILHLEASKGWGGQEMRIIADACGMRDRGHHVLLVVSRGGDLVQRARSLGFRVYELNFQKWAWPMSLLRLLFLMRKEKIDLLHTHSSLDAWLGGIAARLTQRAVVRTRHLSTAIRRGYNSLWLYGKLADFVITTCSSILRPIIEQSGKKESLCRCVATGVDLTRVAASPTERRAFRQSLHVSPSQFLVGTACFLRSWKGIFDFLEGAHQLRHHNDLRWVIIGGGEIDRYRKRAEELALQHLVTFTGHLESPFAALASLDLFALLSTAHEGISQAMLQAAFFQKPLIATTVGGLNEVCLNGCNGLLIPPRSPQLFADKVMFLKNNPLLCRDMGQRGTTLVREQFSLEHTLNATEEIYSIVRKP